MDSPPLHIVAPNFEPNAVGGAGEVMVQLTESLLRLHNDVSIYLNHSAAKHFPQWRDNVIELHTGEMRGNAIKAWSMLRFGLMGNRKLPRTGVSWFPFGTMMPFAFRSRGVVTIHDTLDRDFPERVGFLERQLRRIMIPRTVRRCAVVTSSRFSQQRIRHHYGVESTVVPLAAIPLPPPASIDLPSTPYVFYAANGWPHKNHQFLLRMWRAEPRLREIALVFTLGSGAESLAASLTQARAEGVQVIVAGRLSRAELAAYYRSALCSVLPSIYEGFGLTAQESLLANCPALVSDCACLPETMPSDYPFLLPLHSGAWTEVILALQSGRRQDVRSWAIHTTWDDVAKKYLEILMRCESFDDPRS